MNSEDTTFSIDAAACRRALTTALAFTSTDGARPWLRCINVSAGADAVTLTATDQHVMSHERLQVAGEPFDFLLPAHVAKRLLTFMPKPTRKKPPIGMVAFAQGDGQVTAHVIGVEVTGGLKMSVTFDPGDAGWPFPDFQKVLTAFGGEPCTIPEIHFNPALLTRVMRAVSARGPEPVRLAFTTPLKPLILTHGDNDNFNAMVMPVRMRRPTAAKAA